MNKSLPELERPEFSEQEAGLLLEENYGLCSFQSKRLVSCWKKTTDFVVHLKNYPEKGIEIIWLRSIMVNLMF